MAGWLDVLLFRLARFRNSKANRIFKQQYPGTVLPADYVLYETYQLNYRKFIEDGDFAAQEIIAWTKPYIPLEAPRVLDWGCGAGRIIRHLRALHPEAGLFGCDINEEMIVWNKKNYQDASFTTIHHFTPTPYAPGFFDLVYGISIFTHIEASKQTEWLVELHRILNHNGILLLTTQGSFYDNRLLPKQRKILHNNGVFTQPYSIQGHRMMSTYNQAGEFRKMINPYFTVLEYYEGEKFPGKIGGQDVWILRKRTDE